MKNILTKNCIVCGKKFIKPESCGLPEWFGCERRPSGRRFCSKKCSNTYKEGKHFSSKTEFKKGQKSWLKGTKGLVELNSGSFKKGQKPFNKGLKGDNYLSETSKKRMGDYWRGKEGKNSPNWKGGRTALRIMIRTLNIYKQWRTSIFFRDNHTCQKCGARRKVGDRVVIQVHHLKAFYKILEENNITTIQQVKECKELWDLSNGETLCISCHRQTDSYLVNQYTK